MQNSRYISFFGTFLGLGILSLGSYNRLAMKADYTCLEDTLRGKLCREEISKEMTEKAWGNVGALAYQSAAELMVANNAIPQPLDETQKRYLRPHFGDLVDRVLVVYNATLMEDWLAASFQIKVGVSNAQVYGHRIYIKDVYKPSNFEQLVLLAHELIHCKQYEELGNLSDFGYHYFKQYKHANESYKENIFEKEAFAFEKKFAKWLANEIAQEKSQGKARNNRSD